MSLVVLAFATALSACGPGDDTGAESPVVITDEMRSQNSRALQLKPGESTGFLLRGPVYDTVHRLRVRRFEASDQRALSRAEARAQAGSDAVARIGRKTRQGRWVQLETSENTAAGLYWMEAYGAKRKYPLLAIPVVVEVVAQSAQIERSGNIPSAADVMSAIGDAPGDDNGTFATVSLTGSFPTEIDPACYLAAELMQEILHEGGTPPCQSGVGIYLGESKARIISHFPKNVGQTNEMLHVTGRHLPNEDFLTVLLGEQALDVSGGDSDNLYARLPDDPASGRLLVKRKYTDEVLAQLDAEYQVVPAPEPDTSLFGGFDSSASAVTWRSGYQLAMLSWIVYFDDLNALLDPSGNFGDLLGIDLVSTEDITTTDPDQDCNKASGSMQWASFHHETSNTLIVSIRGSQTGSAAQDWTDNDLDNRELAKPAWAPGAIVHCGFHQAAKVVYDDNVDEIQAAHDAGERIWLTGHSLGGSAAQVLAAMLEWDSDIDVDAVYTFGSPPIGNSTFVSALGDAVPVIHRFEIEHDPAVSFGYDAGFRQAGTAHRLYANGNTDLNAGVGFDSYPGLSPIQKLIDLLYAHMDYWCRIYAEYDEDNLADLQSSVVTPPQNPDGGYNCDVNDFYGPLATTF